jgi:glutathione-regulated potassium-efflux system protein KefB
VHALLSAAVILSMALTPVAVFVLRRLLSKGGEAAPDMSGIQPVAEIGQSSEELAGTALIIGFGRFGQIASQALLARGIQVTIIENDTDMIRSASTFGFHAYYGDGTRMDVLHASGAAHVRALLICVDDPVATTRIVELVKKEFPLTPVLARAFDRQHAIELIHHGVDFQLRETFESAMRFSTEALRRVGVPEDDIAEICEDIRRRDTERLQLQVAGGIAQGLDLMHGNRWTATPLTRPQHSGQALNEEAAEAIEAQPHEGKP